MQALTATVTGTVAVVMSVLGVTLLGTFRWIRERRIVVRRQDPRRPVRSGRLSYDDIGAGVSLLVADARAFRPDRIVAINRGGAIVGGCIAKQLGIPVVEHLHVNCDNSPEVTPVSDATRLGGRVYLVDDACRKGEHMRVASAYLRSRDAVTELRRACLLRLLMSHAGPETETFNGACVEVSAFFTSDASAMLPWDVDWHRR